MRVELTSPTLERSCLCLILGLGLIRGILYALVVPPWQAPDEIAHFEYARLVLDLKRPVAIADASPDLEHDIIQSLYQFRAWDFAGYGWPDQPPSRLAEIPFFGRSRTLGRFSLAYVVYALAAWPWRGQNVVVQLYAMRLASVILGLGSIALTWLAARRLVPHLPALATGATLFVTFWPQHTLQMSTVSEGALAELFVSGVIYLFVVMAIRGVTWRYLGGSLACGLLALITKATAYFLVPFALIVGLDTVLPWLYGRLQRKRLVDLIWLAGLFLGGLGVSVLVVRSRIGDNNSFASALNLLKATVDHPSDAQQSILKLLLSGQLSTYLWFYFRSAWAVLGWNVLFLPDLWYQVLLVLCLLALLGLILRGGRLISANRRGAYGGLGLAAGLAIAAPMLISFLLWNANPQDTLAGRYFLAAAMPISILLVLGWLSLWPKRSSMLVCLITVGSVVFDTAVLISTAVPFFYPYR